MFELTQDEKRLVLNQLIDSYEFLDWMASVNPSNANLVVERDSVRAQISNLRASFVK
jgi:hypothetical protein